MAIGGKNIIDENGKKFWADKQSQGLPLSYEAETKLKLGQFSVDGLLELLEQNRFSAQQLILLGHLAGKLGNAWLTEMAFTEAIDMEPDFGTPYGDLISYYAAQRDWASCDTIWNNGMLRATEKAYIAYHYARALYMQGKYADALDKVQDALKETDFGMEEAVLLALHAFLGKIAEKQTDDIQSVFRQAKQIWKAACRKFPNSKEIAGLEHILAKDEIEE